ncbi:MAG TPA: hypothetical protein VGH38_22400 [Bryobacteraceae bacterium]
MPSDDVRTGRENRISDREFVAGLRAAVEQYFQAVDRWEAAYQKYYRLPGYAAQGSDDLEPEYREYCARRSDFEAVLPRARRLCLKHQLRDPFSGLLRISLGRYAPQQRMDSAIGRSERAAVTDCLVRLNDACTEWEPAPASDRTDLEPEKQSLLRRFVSYFY